MTENPKCQKCRNPRAPNSVLCESCRSKAVERYYTRKVSGMCVKCGEPQNETTVFCDPCQIINKTRLKARREQISP